MEDSYIRLEKPGFFSEIKFHFRMCHPPNITSEMEISAALSFFLSFFASRLVVVVVVDLYQWTCCVESKQESGQACTGAAGEGVFEDLSIEWNIYCFLISCFVYTTRNQQAKPYMVPPLFEVKLTSILPNTSHYYTCSITNEFSLVHFNCA